MFTTTIHSPIIATEKFPVFTSVDQKKIRRYSLCLEMVQKIVEDFFPTRHISSPLFRQLGEIACCIDTHLDDLCLDQKESLLQLFPSFFDAIGDNPDEDIFNEQLHVLCNKLNTTLYPPSWAAILFRFYIFCSRHDLLQQLKFFSVKVIEAGILKSKAKTAKDILKSLKQEGSASISFLLELLQKEYVIPGSGNKLMRLKKYLCRLEKMLNIADDIGDHKKDKSKGTITLHTGFIYHFTLCSKLLVVFFSTLAGFPVFFTRHFFVFSYRYTRSELG